MDAISDVSRGSQIFSAVPVFPPLPDPIDIDELLGFNVFAKKKLLIEEKVETRFFIKNNVFINHVDSFIGKRLLSSLKSYKSKRTLTQEHLVENNVIIQDEPITILPIEHENDTKPTTRKRAKSKESINKSSNKIQDGKEKANIDQSGYASPILNPEIPDIENTDTSIAKDEVRVYDTSKLTVAEYYELLEKETYLEKEEFLSDKLGKYLIEGDVSKHEFQKRMYDKGVFSKDHVNCFEITGTLKNIESRTMFENEVKEIIPTFGDIDFFNKLVRCGVIIYNVNEYFDQIIEANWAFNYILNFIEKINGTSEPNEIYPPVFILISSFMTWSLTEPLCLNDPELPFIERDYPKRKPHPNYRSLFELEEKVVQARIRNRLKTLVIVSGIPYGHEEFEFVNFFEMAYNNEHLPIYGSGNNIIPTIHVDNIGQILIESLKRFDEIKLPFIFAKDPAQNTIGNILQALSYNFGTGYCEMFPEQFALIKNEFSQDLYDKITSNIILESSYPLFEEKDIKWKYESGFSDNVKDVIEEYLKEMKIRPVRIILYGCSDSEKFKNISHKLCDYFKITHLSPTNIILKHATEMQELQKRLKNIDDPTEKPIVVNETYKPTAGFTPKLVVCEGNEIIHDELIRFENLNIEDMNKLSDNEQIAIIKKELETRYKYHGYLMEEYPQTLMQAQFLFSDNISNESATNGGLSNVIPIFPQFVVCINKLEEPQEVMEMDSERQVIVDVFNTSSSLTTVSENEREPVTEEIYEEYEGVERKLSLNEPTETNTLQGRENLVDSSVILFYQELNENCKIINFDINSVDSENEIFKNLVCIIEKGDSNCQSLDGHSINFNQNLSELSMDERPIYNEKNIKEQTRESLKEYFKNLNFKTMKEEEELILSERSYPILSYLINSIFPTLTNGILETTIQRPDDPVDFLAEYIFKNNPDGKMIDPLELKSEELLRNRPRAMPMIDSKACLA